MLFYVVASIAWILLSGLYVFLYYHRFNNSLVKKTVGIYKVTPKVFILALAFIGLISSGVNSVINVYALENRVSELEEVIIENPYATGEFSNDELEYIYTYYNMYFGGYYFEGGSTIVCIRQDAPQELIEYMEINQVLHVFVEFNYSDLWQLHQTIVDSRIDGMGLCVINIDIKTNKVIIDTSEVDFVTNRFQMYIDEGILEVRLGGEIDYLT